MNDSIAFEELFMQEVCASLDIPYDEFVVLSQQEGNVHDEIVIDSDAYSKLSRVLDNK